MSVRAANAKDQTQFGHFYIRGIGIDGRPLASAGSLRSGCDGRPYRLAVRDVVKADDCNEHLGAYATGTLAPTEERSLYQAALDDQELFNALAHEEFLREALEDHEFRQSLKRRLHELNEPTASVRLLALVNGLFRPPALAVAGMVAIVGFAILTRVPDTQRVGDRTVKSAATNPATLDAPTIATGKGLFSESHGVAGENSPREALQLLWEHGRLGPHEELNLRLDLEGHSPKYRKGEQVRFRVSAPIDASVMLLAMDPDRAIMQLLPMNEDSLHESELACVPMDDQSYSRLAETVGSHKLRLLAFQGSADPLDPALANSNVPLAVERSYEVIDQ